MPGFRVRQTKAKSCRRSLLRRFFGSCCSNTRCDWSAGNRATVLCGLAVKKLTCLVPLMSSQILSTLHMTSCQKEVELRDRGRGENIFISSLFSVFSNRRKNSHLLGVQPGHLVLEHACAHGVGAGADISVAAHSSY